jgi:hypothetical protein
MMYKIPYGQWLDCGISDDSSETEPFIDEDDSSETEPFIDEAQLLEDDKELGQKFHYVSLQSYEILYDSHVTNN